MTEGKTALPLGRKLGRQIQRVAGIGQRFTERARAVPARNAELAAGLRRQLVRKIPVETESPVVGGPTETARLVADRCFPTKLGREIAARTDIVVKVFRRAGGGTHGVVAVGDTGEQVAFRRDRIIDFNREGQVAVIVETLVFVGVAIVVEAYAQAHFGGDRGLNLVVEIDNRAMEDLALSFRDGVRVVLIQLLIRSRAGEF